MRPMVELAPADGNELDFTPTEARRLAAALISAADELDPPEAPDQDG